jgi:hypothetical protein
MQQGVAGAARHVEHAAEIEHHGAAGAGAAGLEERNVPGRDIGAQAEIELAELSRFPPVPEQITELRGHCRLLRHPVQRLFRRLTLTHHRAAARPVTYLQGNCAASAAKLSWDGQQGSFDMEIAHTQTWLKAAAGIVLGVGLLLAAGAWPPLAAPVVFLADLIIWPLDGLQTLAAPETRVFMAISGGVMVGWGVTLWKLADYLMPEQLAAVRSITMTGLYSWFVVDSIGRLQPVCRSTRSPM